MKQLVFGTLVGVSVLLSAAAGAGAGATRLESLEIGPGGDRVLRGPDAARQLVVTGTYSDRRQRDLTREVSFATSPEGVVAIDDQGLVTPLADGTTTVTATPREAGAGPAATAELTVENFATELPVNFPNRIVPIFTKLGCNGGGCHGKSSGQNGFKLSLLGFYPDEDHEYLVKEARGRRIFGASPERSLLLQKATNTLPHGGGERLDPGSFEYRLLRRWIIQGMPYGNRDDPTIESLRVHPGERRLERGEQQQLAILAHYTDGSVEDVTRMAQFESNNPEMAAVSAGGLVTVMDLTGDVAVMIRFQDQVGVFRATIPLGIDPGKLPPARNVIDERVFAKLRALGIPPSPVCDDSTFLRRVTIDICGRLPTAGETRSFLASEDPEKRDRWIDRLLASGEYADYFANKWSAILRNKRVNSNYQRGTYAFHDWIRETLHRNRPYDEFVRDILAASGEVGRHPPVVWYRSVRTTSQQVEDAAQLFLGVRIQCARCHHHPFERWSQRDYYGFAAFFSRVARKNGVNGLRRDDEPRIYHNRGRATARNPRTGENLPPTGLGGEPREIPAERDPRLDLADWLADESNPFFAPALVNRYWKHFFGRGIVEAEDDMRVTNPASNPELLDALARYFVDSRFDLKKLIRLICRSTTYQLASAPNEHNVRDHQNHSRFYPRRLNAEVLLDALDQVTGSSTGFSGMPRGMRAVALPDTGVGNYLLSVFGRPQAESACECERSQEANLAQSLHLLNSSEIQGKLSAREGRAAVLARDEARSDEEKVRELYLWTYSRPPVESELKLAVGHIVASKNRQEAYEDILWALLNTKEFLFNH